MVLALDLIEEVEEVEEVEEEEVDSDEAAKELEDWIVLELDVVEGVGI